jgi:AraC-like DNA-binding protein
VRHLLETDASAVGWLAGLREPRVNRALQAMHGAPMRRWTVAQLAEVAGQSRSAFSAQFKRFVGQAPLEYLTQWRMTVATRRLEVERTPMLAIAQQSGYPCEVAFHRAFKRVTGRTPGAVRRTAREPRARP